jgi:hypothetical protein
MKNLWLILALLVGVIFASMQCHADNALLLPAGHWSYNAMNELAKDGLFNGFQHSQFGSDILTRYELAYYLKLLIVNLEKNKQLEAKLTDKDIRLLKRLIEEFTDELVMLGINIMDLEKMSPSISHIHKDDEGYFDLDYVLSNDLSTNPNSLDLTIPLNLSEPYYFMGEYLTDDLRQKVFFFSPEVYIDPKLLLELKVNKRWDILYSSGNELQISFIIIKGSFPVGSTKVDGYYFLPVENQKKRLDVDVEKAVYNLVNSLSTNYEVNNLWQFKGSLPFSKTLGEETYERWQMTNGLQIGEFLIRTVPKEDQSSANVGNPLTTSGFADIDEWLKNPLFVENQPLESTTSLFSSDLPVLKQSDIDLNWNNLITSTSPWFNDLDLGLSQDPLATWDNNYSWGYTLDNQWSRLMFNFRLLSEKSLLEQSLLF